MICTDRCHDTLFTFPIAHPCMAAHIQAPHQCPAAIAHERRREYYDGGDRLLAHVRSRMLEACGVFARDTSPRWLLHEHPFQTGGRRAALISEEGPAAIAHGYRDSAASAGEYLADGALVDRMGRWGVGNEPIDDIDDPSRCRSAVDVPLERNGREPCRHAQRLVKIIHPLVCAFSGGDLQRSSAAPGSLRQSEIGSERECRWSEIGSERERRWSEIGSGRGGGEWGVERALTPQKMGLTAMLVA